MTHPHEATLRKRTKLIVGVVFTVLSNSTVDRQVGQAHGLSEARASRLLAASAA